MKNQMTVREFEIGDIIADMTQMDKKGNRLVGKIMQLSSNKQQLIIENKSGETFTADNQNSEILGTGSAQYAIW